LVIEWTNFNFILSCKDIYAFDVQYAAMLGCMVINGKRKEMVKPAKL